MGQMGNKPKVSHEPRIIAVFRDVGDGTYNLIVNEVCRIS